MYDKRTVSTFRVFLGSGSPDRDGSCMLWGRGTVLYGARQIRVVVFQRWTSDIYLPKFVDFLVRDSKFWTAAFTSGITKDWLW